MADKKISQLPVLIDLNPSDAFPVVRTGNEETNKVTAGVIFNNVPDIRLKGKLSVSVETVTDQPTLATAVSIIDSPTPVTVSLTAGTNGQVKTIINASTSTVDVNGIVLNQNDSITLIFSGSWLVLHHYTA